MENPRRLNYFTGEFLSLADWEDEQRYHESALWRHDRDLHVWGIAGGAFAMTTAKPAGTVVVGPGLAVDGDGREIVSLTSRVLVFPPGAAQYYVTVAYHEEPADPLEDGTNYKRVAEVPEIAWSPDPPVDPERQLLLAVVSVAADGSVAGIDPSGRRYVSIEVGRLVFHVPGFETAVPPSVEAGLGVGASLRVVAAETHFSGDLLPAGRLGVGTAAPGAVLDVAGTPALPGTGQLCGCDDTRVRGCGTAFDAELRAGDLLTATTTAGTTGTAFVRAVVDVETLVTDQPLRCGTSPFYYRQALALRLGTAATTSLSVTAGGAVGVGTGAPAARLHVADGDLRVDGGEVAFFGSGQVTSRDARHQIVIDGGVDDLSFREAGAIRFSPGPPPVPEERPMVLAASGNAGIGVPSPAQKLSVDGVVAATGGYRFPDGTLQTAAAVSVPLGSVLDWWLPQGQIVPPPAGFMICNGGPLPAESPLRKYGQVRVPDLSHRFVRGVPFDQQNQPGGVAEHVHTVSVPAHDHPIPHTHASSGGTTGLSNRGYVPVKFDWDGGTAYIYHTHSYTLNFGSAFPDYSDDYPAYQKDTEPFSSFPPYLTLLKIIRVI